MVSGPLTDYSFTTEGTTKKYSAQIADASYPVLGHVVYYLTQLQKGVPVEAYLDKDGRISKIVSAPPASKKGSVSVRTPEEIAAERDAYNAQAKAADEARNQERKKAELAKIAADAANAEKLKASGFGNPTPGPAPAQAPNGNPVCAECQKTRVESIRGKVCNVLGVPCNQISRERCQVEIETEKRNTAAAKAAPATPQEKVKDCTSPETPVVAAPAPAKPAPTNGLKTVVGQIASIDAGKRAIAIKDDKDTLHLFHWLAANDAAFSRLQKWWFAKITGEQRGEDDWIATSQTKADKPAGWKNAGGGYGGKPVVPRNEKPMIYESAFKSCVDLFDPEKDGKGKSYEENVARVIAQADLVVKWMIAGSGV
jgi:hypothetical protein